MLMKVALPLVESPTCYDKLRLMLESDRISPGQICAGGTGRMVSQYFKFYFRLFCHLIIPRTLVKVTG